MRAPGREHQHGSGRAALVNAAGPWVNDVIGRVGGRNSRLQGPAGEGQPHRGAEILGRAAGLSAAERRQARDLRQPLSGRPGLIGTTDIPYDGKPEEVAIEEHEIDYLLRVVNRYVVKPLTRGGYPL